MSATSILSALALLATAPSGRSLPPLDALAGYPELAAPLSKSLRDPAYVRPGLPLETEMRFGVPTFFWAEPDGNTQSPRQAGATPESAARAALARFAPLYGFQPTTLPELRVLGIHDLGHGAVVVRLGAFLGGVRIFRDEVAVVMDAELRAVALSGYLAPLPRSVPAARLSAKEAAVQAFAAVDHPLSAEALTETRGLEGEQAFALAKPAAWLSLPQPVRVRRIDVHLPDRLLPAFDVQLLIDDGQGDHQGYAVIVSAVDGAPLFRRSQVQYDSFSYRVWAGQDLTDGGAGAPFDGPQGDGPTPSPTGLLSQPVHPPFVSPGLLTLDHGPTALADPWLPASSTETVGNNCDAYLDLYPPDGYSPAQGDFRAAVTAPGVFDHAYDLAAEPDANPDQQMAATTQLFYDVNYFHDWYYGVGFTEAAGNAQLENYGRGGRAGDPLYAEAQDYSGTDNSNMYTPSDGRSPVMQMYVWNGAVDTRFTVSAPAALAQTYGSAGAEFAPENYAVSGEVVAVGGAHHDGCAPLSADDGVAGKIALVDRGTCTFAAKARNAGAAGAAGLVVADNTAEAPFFMVGDGRATPSIPAQMISQADGAALRAGTAVQATLTQQSQVARDGDLDNQIVAHEWGHYISNRLIHDSEGLNTNMSGGMGEGWADFHAMLLTVKEGDDQVLANPDWSGTYALTGYVAAATDPDGAYYWGIRRVPYSTDLSKDPLTFADIQEGQALPANVPVAFGRRGFGNSEVHNTGEVWASMLWECYAALLRDTPARLSFTEAQTRMRAYLVAAYQATPANPTFLEARDALLAVAYAADPTDFAAFQRAFAKRGAGLHAQSPDRFSGDNLGVVEDYAFGNDLALVSASLSDDVDSCDHDGVLDDGETGSLTVTLKNVGGAALRQTRASVTSQNPAVHLTSATVDVPESDPFGPPVTVQIPVSLSGASGVSPLDLTVALTDPLLTVPQPVALPFHTTANFDSVANASASDDFESPELGWNAYAQAGQVAGPGGNLPLDTSATWQRIAISPTDHRIFGPDDGQPSLLLLISPPLQVGSGHAVAYFRARWSLEVDADDPTVSYDGATIEVSTDNGDTWVDVGRNGTVGPDHAPLYAGVLDNSSGNPYGGSLAIVGQNPSWPALDEVAVDLGDLAGQTAVVRFTMTSDAAAAAYGMELDDVRFRGIVNTPFAAVVPDRQICEADPPRASASGPKVLRSGERGELHGSASTDGGAALSFRWSQVGGPQAELEDPSAAETSFIAPAVEAPASVQFQLAVNDGISNGVPATVQVTVLPPVPALPPKKFEAAGAAPDGGGCGSSGAGFELLAVFGALLVLRRRD